LGEWKWIGGAARRTVAADADAREATGGGGREVVERGGGGGHGVEPQMGAAAGTGCGGVGFHGGSAVVGRGGDGTEAFTVEEGAGPHYD
jgi:hypothetical protein